MVFLSTEALKINKKAAKKTGSKISHIEQHGDLFQRIYYFLRRAFK
jgi:hypothetical protein